MSRIYDALKRAQRDRAVRGPRAQPSSPDEERRVAERYDWRMPLFVYGYGMGQEPFYEPATSLVVNANGALLALTNQVIPGQQLRLTNAATHAEQNCRVVHLRAAQGRQAEVGVAFDAPAPEFWMLPEAAD
jgi:hypothetical protein